jgi:hypothetical protein
MRAPSDVDPEVQVVAALDRRFAGVTPDATFADALEQRIIARHRERAGVRPTGVRTWFGRAMDRLALGSAARHIDTDRSIGMDDTRYPPGARRGPDAGGRRVGLLLRPTLAAVAVIVAMVVLGMGAGTDRLSESHETAGSIVGRIWNALPLLPSVPDADGFLPLTEPGALYVVPGVGILPLGEDDLVQAQSPLVFNTDLVSGTVFSLWSSDEGTAIAVVADVSKAMASFRAKYPDSGERIIDAYLVLDGEYGFGSDAGGSLTDWGVAEVPPPRQFGRLSPERSAVDLTILVTDSLAPVEYPGSPNTRDIPRRAIEASVSVPLASPRRGDLARAIPCDKRAEAGGVTVRADAVAFAADATYVRLDAAASPPADIEIDAFAHGGGGGTPLEQLARLVALRDDRGRSYAPIGIPGGPLGVRHGLAIGRGNSITLRFEPVAPDARTVSFSLAALRAGSDVPWVGSGNAVTSFAVPLPTATSDADSFGARSRMQCGLCEGDHWGDRPTSVPLDRTLTVDGIDLTIVSVDPVFLDDSGARYDVLFAAHPERNGRLLRGLGFGQVGRVGLHDWRKIGGWRDLGRRYCYDGGYNGTTTEWRSTDPHARTDWVETVMVDTVPLKRGGGTIELCVRDPSYDVFGPWEILLPVPAADGG